MTVAAHKERARVLAPGARIGRKLEILRHLGDGGMGALWVARNLTTEAEVAIKVLHGEGDDDEDAHAAARFRHEARLGAMLAHRNITRVFDLLEDDDGSLVLVMELLHGETLQDYCEAKGPLTCREAVEIVVPILSALQHAHEHNVVHRDIKPSNIFLAVDPDGHATPKLLDFGIAKMQDSSIKTRAGNVLGTPSFMSPEQVRASDNLDGRSDLFGIGCVLYTVITGDNPFRTDSPSATLARVLEMEVDPDPRIEPRLWLEIQRVLSKQTYERHATARELADALSNALADGPPRSLRREKPTSASAPPPSSAFASAPALPFALAPAPAPAFDFDDPKTEPHLPPMAALAAALEPDEQVAAVALPKPLPRAKLLGGAAAIVIVIVIAAVLVLRSGSKTPAPETTLELDSDPVASGSAPVTAAANAPSGEAASSPPRQAGGAGPASPPRHSWKRPPPPKTPPSASAPPVARTPGF